MKKKILFLSILISVTLLFVVGCKNSSTSSVDINGRKFNFIDTYEFNDLKFKYDKNAKDFVLNEKDEEHTGLIFYKEGTEEDLFRVTITSYKDIKIKSILERYELDENSKKTKINGIEWYDYLKTDDSKYRIQVYFYQNKKDSYIISFAVEKKLRISMSEYIKEFMNNVSFK